MHETKDTTRTRAVADLPVEALDYELPEQLIARRPAEPRDSARLLIVRRSGGDIEHRMVRDLPKYLQPNDLMVFNNTAVLPARITGRRIDSGGRLEGLYLHDLPDGSWQVMLRSNGRLRPGLAIALLDADENPGGAVLHLQERIGAHWRVRVDADCELLEVLQRFGRTPLPPYILRARSHSPIAESIADAADRAWYQTVYSDSSQAESVAAPTAGLHFTGELLAAIDDLGVDRLHVTLHVGAGTFKPVETAMLSQHTMHCERFAVSAEVCDSLQQARDQHRRIIAVGTTTVRTLESLPQPLPKPAVPITGETDLCIAPGYCFKHVDAMMTNFHLPRSTLLALAGAFIGLDRLLDIYRQAIAHEYRFYSYGDAMLILP